MWHIKASYSQPGAVESLKVPSSAVPSLTSPWPHRLHDCLTHFSLTGTHFHNASSLSPPPLHPTFANLNRATNEWEWTSVWGSRSRTLCAVLVERREVWSLFTRPFGCPGSFNRAHGLCHTWYLSNESQTSSSYCWENTVSLRSLFPREAPCFCTTACSDPPRY